MADKTIGELTAATKITDNDLFVLEQSSEAKSLSGATLLDYLVTPVTKKVDMHGGIKTIIQNEDYTLTITFADGTTFTTTDVRGQRGATGPQGRSVSSILKTQTVGLEDTYTIRYSSGGDSTFTVTNGSEIESISLTDTNGLEDTYTVTLTNGNATEFYVTNGNGIKSIECSTATPGQADTTDYYTITFDDGKTFQFPVKNGKNGTGSVTSVNGQDGAVVLTGENIDVSSSDTTKVSSIVSTVSALSESVETLETNVANKQPETSTLSTMTALADGDSFPIYDESDKSNKRMLWSNMVTSIVTKIRSAFRTTALSVDSGGTGASTAADARTNLDITPSNIGAAAEEHTHDASNIASGTLSSERIPAIDGSKITDGTITIAKLYANAKYWDEAPRTNDSSDSASFSMTASWGHIFNWCWGTNHYFQFDYTELQRCDNFWETIVYGASDIELVFQNPDSSDYMHIIELNKRTNTVATEIRITVPQYRFVHIKKIGGVGLLLSGNYDSSYISSGTADPSGGLDGDIYLKYSE